LPSRSDLSSQAAQTQTSRIFADAVAAHKSGRLGDAEAGYRRVLADHPLEAEPNYLLGSIFMVTDRPHESLEALRTCLQANANHVPALNAIGGVYARLEQHDDAIGSFERAANIQGDDPKIWFNLGLACVEIHRYGRAVEAFEETLKLDGSKWEALNGYGLCLLELGRVQEAISALLRCIAKAPALESAHANLVRCLIKNKQIDDAMARCATAIQTWPNAPVFHLLMADAKRKSGEVELSTDCLRGALDVDPYYVPALNQLAGQLNDQGQWKEAEKFARRSLEIEPNTAVMLTMIGHIRQMRGDLNGAHLYYNKAIESDPGYAEAHNNLGNVLNYMDRAEESLAAFGIAAKLKPDSEGIRLNRAIAQMTAGNIYPASKDYRLRLAIEGDRAITREWAWPAWDEQPLKDKRVLLWADQGIGDQILFSRYAPQIVTEMALGVLECSPRLIALFERSFPNIEFVEQTTPPDSRLTNGPFDFHSAIIDVCCARYRDASHIPAAPLLKADPALTRKLRKKYLEASGGRPLVGISWRSGGTHTSHFKSTDLDDWSGILGNESVAFVNLQYGNPHIEVANVLQQQKTTIISDENVNPLLDLDPVAAQIAALDLIITTSNTTAHLAGALGKEVWNMTPIGPGRLWYWFAEGSETPWYTNMTLLRHSYSEGWGAVLNDVRDRLIGVAPRLGNEPS